MIFAVYKYTFIISFKKDDANNILISDMMGLVNTLAHSLFKQISVRLNGTLINPQTDTYHYNAFVRLMASLLVNSLFLDIQKRL